MILLANWKQNFKKEEVQKWFLEFAGEMKNINQPPKNLEIVIAPSFHYLYLINDLIDEYGLNYIKLCPQNVSPYQDGPHTGEVGAAQLSDVCEYVLLGHSERKKLGETKEIIVEKVKRTLGADLKPIVCFASDEEFEYYKNKFGGRADDSIIYAYEPPGAISTHEGGSTGPEPVSEVSETASRLGLEKLIYGGSVSSENIANYLNLDEVCGFLVGGASLSPAKFAKMALTFYV
jgi:triosephosphate isomerase (TIM)